MKTIAAVSVLHEVTAPLPSTGRLFRDEPVLRWTLRRLRRCAHLAEAAVVCASRQAQAAEAVCEGATVRAVEPSSPRHIEAITAALRWSDGWRGGLLGACAFDRGFDAKAVAELCEQRQAEAVVLIDGSAALVDAALVDGMIQHAQARPEEPLCFTPAAPGLGGVLLRRALVEKLAESGIHPGRLLHYWPDLPARDPIGVAAAAPVPTVAARTLHRFTCDSDRQKRLLERATASLNGQLITAQAAELVVLVSRAASALDMPRDVTLELNTNRATRPIYWPGERLGIEREPLSPERARPLFEELAQCDDLRLTLAGVGDPLLAPGILEIIQSARDAGIRAIHVETDLVGVDEAIVAALADAPIDVLSVHIPAFSTRAYEMVMGIDGLKQAVANIARFAQARQATGRGTPLLAPTFAKCTANLAEMEVWYDHWLKACGSAVIVGPSDYGGRIEDVAAADMCPPMRCPCRRLGSRMTILCDGRVAACEEDVLGEQSPGIVGSAPIRSIWMQGMSGLRDAHACGRWDQRPLCASCRQWHRP